MSFFKMKISFVMGVANKIYKARDPLIMNPNPVVKCKENCQEIRIIFKECPKIIESKVRPFSAVKPSPNPLLRTQHL